jgi:hypothetical protein
MQVAAEAAGRGSAAVAVLAQGLVGLRDNAEGPVGAELTAATGLDAQVVADALAGGELPTLSVTLALVGAWGGDVVAWEAYWQQIAGLAAAVRESAAESAGSVDRSDAGGADGAEADGPAASDSQSGRLAAQESEVPAPPPLMDMATLDTASQGEPSKDPDGPKAAESNQPTDIAKAEREHVTAEPPAATATAAAEPTPAPAAVNSESLPPAKPPRAEAAEARQSLHPHRRLHLILLALVVLLAAGGGLLAYGLVRSDNTAHQAAAPSPSGPVGTASATGASASTSAPSSRPSSAFPTPTTSPISTTPTTPPSITTTATTTPTPLGTPATRTQSATAPPQTPGTLLGLYPKVQLPSGYSVDLLDDTFHPVPGSAIGGDTLGLAALGPAAGRFVAGQAVLFDADEPGTFERCLNDTRYQQDVSLAALSVGSLFCVHGPSGELALVKVDRLPQPQDANPYVMIDLTIWQGR